MLTIFDKLLFGTLLLAFFQLPIFATQFGQYIGGYYEATAEEVRGYEETARRNNFPSAQALIDAHMLNTAASVRDDAIQKQNTIERLALLERGNKVFSSNSLFNQTLYLLSPKTWPMATQVAQRFSPGIPLSPTYLGVSTLLALIFSSLILWPFKLAGKKKSRPAIV